MSLIQSVGRLARWGCAVLLCALAGTAGAAGLMSPAGGGAALTLSEQHVSVSVDNGYAVTEIEQVFANPQARDLTAIYRFPVPRDAIVGEFTYWIDGQPVHAEVMEKQAARALHESEKQQGRETALVEKDAYKAFQVDVYPVRAQQSVRTRLVYLQRADIDHSVGRYVYPLEDGGTEPERDAFWARNESVSEAFSFTLTLRSAYPVDAVRVPRGQAQVRQLDSGHWEVSIEHASGGSGATIGQGLGDADLAAIAERESPSGVFNRGASQASSPPASVFTLDSDIVVYWRLAGNLPGAVDLVTYRAPGEPLGTFMLTLTPGIDLQPITEGRDWVFVLDQSGSMQGKFGTLLSGVELALGQLNPADRFRVVMFNSAVRALSPGFLPADDASVQRTLSTLKGLSPDSGTDLHAGLDAALKSLDADRTAAIVLVTDGVANLGPTEIASFVKLFDKRDVRLFTAVMGNGANTPLLDTLTTLTEGFAVTVSNNDDIVGLLKQIASKVSHQALHDLGVSIDGVTVRDLTPERPGRVYRGQQISYLGRYSGHGKATLTLDAAISGEAQRFTTDIAFPEEDTANPELERLWAFARIADIQARQRLLGTVDADSRQAAKDLALQYGLVTDDTSLVVVRESVFEAENIARSNAGRIERERQARAERAGRAIAQTRQDTHRPMFPGDRSTVSNGLGGGGTGQWLLLLLVSLAGIRGWLEWRERRGSAGR